MSEQKEHDNEKELKGLEEQVEEKVTSLDLLWKQCFQELDTWNERAALHEQALLQSANQFASKVKQNQANVKELFEQFILEQKQWEKAARDEFFMSTTTLQYIFPMKSYEEMNNMLNSYQEKLSEYMMFPILPLTKNEHVEKMIDSMGKYVEFQRESRIQFLGHVKGTLQMVQDGQRNMYSLFTSQVKNMFFPLNKYMERSSELTKS